MGAVADYREKGYTVIQMKNGSGDVKDCLRAVIKYSSYYQQ